MKESILRTKAKAFALHVIAVCDNVDTKKNRGALTNQIVRSSTSVGANIHEAAYGASPADFINKLQIALKECYETEYWISMREGSNSIDAATASQLLQECRLIRFILVKSITTAKKNREKSKNNLRQICVKSVF